MSDFAPLRPTSPRARSPLPRPSPLPIRQGEVRGGERGSLTAELGAKSRDIEDYEHWQDEQRLGVPKEDQ